tara:strand:- start:431 stop:1267 length:837 start_codon:yes stop_codon:yes gene_type:complete
MEGMYQSTKKLLERQEESIHLVTWPEVDEKFIDEKLEHDMRIIGEVIRAGLAAREKAAITLRWPLKEVIVVGDDATQGVVDSYKDVLKRELNTKVVIAKEELPGVEYKAKVNYVTVGKNYGSLMPQIIAHLNTINGKTVFNHLKDGSYKAEIAGKTVELTKEDVSFSKTCPEYYQDAESGIGMVYVNTERTRELEIEGFSREVMRQVQQLRKEHGLEKQDVIKLHIQTDFLEIDLYSEHIKDKCGASEITISDSPSEMETKGKMKIKGKEFTVYFARC